MKIYQYSFGRVGECLSLVALMSVSVFSCKEIGPNITKGQQTLKDTTYMTTVPTADKKVVVVEEYTGAKCVNCPAGHVIIEDLIKNNPDQVAAVSFHRLGGGSICEPVFLNDPGFDAVRYDFRRQETNDIMSAIFGDVSALPQAGVGRVFNVNNKVYGRGLWASMVNSQKTVAPILNLSATLDIEADEKSGILNITGIYTKNVTEKQALNVYLLESDLIAPQEYPTFIDTFYKHKHVFRKTYTPATGLPLMTTVSAIEPGRAFELQIKTAFDPNWKLENCQLVIFVANNEQENKEAQQAFLLKVK